jgi:hypothetical protein
MLTGAALPNAREPANIPGTPGAQVHEAFRQREGLGRPQSASEPEARSRCLEVGDVRRIVVDVLGDLTDLVHPLSRPVFDLLPRSYQDSTPGSRTLNPLALEPLTCGSDRMDRLLSATKSMRSGGTAASMAFERVFESNAEVRIVPADARPAQFLQEEPEVVREHPEVERLVGNRRSMQSCIV